MKRLIGTVRLVHPFPVAVVVLATLILVVVAHQGSPGIGLLARAGGVILLSQLAVGALNDYVDRDADAVAQPDKPIPAQLVSPRHALLLALSSLILFVPLAASFGLEALGLIGLGTCAGLAYDLWLKPTPWSFTMYVVGFLSLLSWIWQIAGHFTPRFLLLYPAGALLLVAAHLAQSFPDVETDRLVGQRGLAAVLGAQRTYRLTLALYLLGVMEGLAIALAAPSWAALALILGGLISPAAVVLLTYRRPLQRGARQLAFRALAPGVAVVGLGCVIGVSALH